jgi:hypothetical protein
VTDLGPGEKHGIARSTPCICASASGMWDRASIIVTPQMLRRFRPVFHRARSNYEKRFQTRYKPANWEENLYLGKLAELAFAELIGGVWTGNSGGAVDVKPDWDVKWTRAGQWLTVTYERGRDHLRYVAATGGPEEIWFLGFATGRAVRLRGEDDPYFNDPGMRLAIAGLHRFPDTPSLHGEVPLVDQTV